MIDFGDILLRNFPNYGWLLIDISHVILGYLAGMYPIIIVLFVVYQIFDIKKGDHLVRDFLFFGIGYLVSRSSIIF